MDSQYPKGLASSQDPAQLSLTVSSVSKVILYLVTFFAVHKGFDPAAATSQVQGLIDLGVNAFPLVMVLFHTVQTMWGLVRKLLSYFKTVPTPPVAVTPVPPNSIPPQL